MNEASVLAELTRDPAAMSPVNWTAPGYFVRPLALISSSTAV